MGPESILFDRARAARIPLLSRLDDDARELLLGRATPRTFAPGAVLVTEGDPGHSMFLLLSGEVEVKTHGQAGTTLTLARLGPGASFGEQALLPDSPGVRTATIAALDAPVRVLEIARKEFLELLLHDAVAHDDLRDLGARQLRERLVASLDGLEGLKVGEGVAEMSYAAGERVFAQGDVGDAAYFVLDGFAVVTLEAHGTVERVGRVGRGQCFGELAVLGSGVRAATVTAEGPLRALRVEASIFRDWYAQDPELRDLVATLQQVQAIGDDGWLTVHRGTFKGRACITSVRHHRDGTRSLATKVIGASLFMITRGGAAEGSSVVFERPEEGIRRELRVDRGVLAEVVAEGPWFLLGEACRRVMEGATVTADELVSFAARGEFDPDLETPSVLHTEIVCPCLRISRRTILSVIAEGNESAESVTAATGCGNVCGACVPTLLELVGSNEYLAVQIDERERIAERIWRLRLSAVGGALPRAEAGQYVLVRGLLDEGWVQRAYTLSDTRPGRTWEILVKREDDGLFSRFLCDAEIGTLLRASAPVGKFLLPEPNAKVVFFAAGVGVTPALAMLRSGDATQSFHLHYSAATDEHFCARGELESMREARANVGVTFRTTRASDATSTTSGRLTRAEITALAKEAPDAWFLLCGPTDYMIEVRAGLRAAKVSVDRILVESFTPVGSHEGSALTVDAKPPPMARPGAQGWPVVGSAVAGVKTMFGPLEQALHCRKTAGEVFTVELPANPSTTYLLGDKAYAFFNALPAETAGIGEVLTLVNLFGRWVSRSDMSPAHLERLALGGKDFVQFQLLRPDQIEAMPAVAEALAHELTMGWEGEIDLADAMVRLVHAICLRCIAGESAWKTIGPHAIPLLRTMASGIDVPRLPVGATPMRFLMRDYWATRKMESVLRELIAAHDDTPCVDLVDDLRKNMIVDGGPLDERDLPWALHYVIFNACAYPGTYGFWSMADILSDASVRDRIVEATTKSDAVRHAEHALLETIRLHPVTVAARILRKEVRYVDESGPTPCAYAVPAGHLLATAPGSFTRDPSAHAEPERYCPHRFAEGESVPSLFGGGAFGCVASSFVRSVLPTIHAFLLSRFELALLDPLPPKKARPALHYPHGEVRARVTRRTQKRLTA